MVQGRRAALVDLRDGTRAFRTVLIVDDSPEDSASHRRFLERSEDPIYEVLEEHSGEAGLKTCFERLPDCVLLDFSMNDMQGIEFLQRLTAGDDGPICPVVMLTGGIQEATAVQAMKAGAHDYLVKGRVSREALTLAIESAIERATLRRQVRETQARLRSALDTMLDSFAIFSAVRDETGALTDLRVDYANDRVCEEAGIQREKLLGRPVSEVLPMQLQPERFGVYSEVIRDGMPRAQEIVQRAGGHSGLDAEIEIAWDVRVSKLDDGVSVAWRDITEHKRADEYVYRMNGILERKVEERTSELKEMVHELEGFTYSVAHDLRSPLRAIIATSRIVLEEAGGKLTEEHLHMLKRQAVNAERLGILIDDLLRLSRISRQELAPKAVDVSSMAREIIAELTPRAILPTFVIQAGLWVSADPILFRLALLNLIENAAKFSPNGGRIDIGGYVDADGDRSVIYVRDQGIGFDMQYAHKLFAPFERLHRESEFPGTGIGLANVQRIIQRHGGMVWAESMPGMGATFYVSLPRS